MRRRLAALALGAALVLAAGSAGAAAVNDLSEAVPDLPGKTWLDLLRQVFADLAPSDKYATPGSATQMIELRSIGVGDESWVGCGDRIELESVDAQTFRIDGEQRVIVSASMSDDCVGLIALFDGAGKLLDAVNVKGDQHVSFAGDYIRPLGPDGALVIVSNWHDNSSQSYESTSLILAAKTGFVAIGDVLAFGSRSCRDQFTEETVTRTAPAKPMARIDVEVKRRAQKFAADCTTKRGRETLQVFTGSWRWNAGRGAYQPHTAQLDALAKANAKDF